MDRLGVRAVLVGDNFRFGHRQAGNIRVLAELGQRLGFETVVVPAVACRGRVVSSSGIRELIAAGRVSLAARFLQHPYALEGDVVSGRGVGSKQTVPTLNLATAAELIPGARSLRDAHPGPGAPAASGIPSPTSDTGRPSARATSSPSRLFCSTRSKARRPTAFAWSFSGACATSASSKRRKR